jgi:hypothetical protein
MLDAWEYIKKSLSSDDLMLYHPDFTIPFVLETDASDVGLSCALTQIIKGKRRVIGYASKTLTDSQKKYSIYQKECFAIIWGTEVNAIF